MDLPHRLSLIVQRTHTLGDILHKAVRIIAEEMRTDVCSIYLVDLPDRRLRLTATHGLKAKAVDRVLLQLGQGLTGTVVAEMRALAVPDASVHPAYLYCPETGEERFRSYLGVPMALRNRPVGAIVVQTEAEREYEPAEVQTLSTIAAQLVGVVENARIIDALDRGEQGSRYLEEVRSWHTLPRPESSLSESDLELRGGGASPGLTMGEAVIRGASEIDLADLEATYLGAEVENARLEGALARTRGDILRIQKEAEEATDEENSLIFSSHLLLLNDDVLLDRMRVAITEESNAPAAAHIALTEFADRLERVQDPYIRDRIEDIFDLRSRLLGHLLGGDRGPDVSDRVVLTRRTPPSLIVELKVKGARGLVTETGGVTSHASLLARSMGIPAVTGVEGITRMAHRGDSVIVDGGEGTVVLRPTPGVVHRYERRVHALGLVTRSALESAGPTVSADGRRVELLANIGVAADLSLALDHGAEGVGLYRTEFPFIIREQFPTLAEQVRIYRKAYRAFPDGPIHFRLLDLGGDKFLVGCGLDASRNPFDGYRSIRVLLDHPEVLRTQVQAFSVAASGRPVSLLIPMVTLPEEVTRVRAAVEEALAALRGRKLPREVRLGAMIEVPAAVEIAAEIAREADFLSIGTNDLIQYAVGVDRESSRLSELRDPFQPSILRMIQRAVAGGRSAGKPVGVCGELARDDLLAPFLLALGVDSLSVTPRSVPSLRDAIAALSVESVEKEIDNVLAAVSAGEVRQRLTGLIRPADAPR